MKTLIVSDIHANLAAFEAVLDKESSWDEFVFLGDAVLAGPAPDEVLSMLRELGGIFIMGNHDHEVLKLDPDAPTTESNILWPQWHRKNIAPQNLEFIATFAADQIVETQGFQIQAFHGHGVLPKEFGGRLWPDSPPEAFKYLEERYTAPIVMSGHTHVQYDLMSHNTRFINPGSAGTAYLGQPLACYAVIEDGQIDLRATPYDIEATCRMMQERARGVVDDDYIEDWIEGWRTGTLPKRYFIRDYAPLRELGYR